MKKIIYIIVGLIFFDSVHALDRKKALELNEQANKLFFEACSNKKVAEQVLTMYDEAINADSTCIPPYENKARLLCQWRKRSEAIKMYEQLSIVHPELLGGALQIIGNIFERMGHYSKAKERYNQAIAYYDSIIQQYPDSIKIRIRIARATVLLFSKGKDVGIEEYEKLVSEFPADKFVESNHDIFYEFSKYDYLKDACE